MFKLFRDKREMEENKGFGCAMSISHFLNREFYIYKHHELDCKEKGIRPPAHSFYLIKRVFGPVKEFYEQWSPLGDRIELEEIYRRQFMKYLNDFPKSEILKARGRNEIIKAIKEEGASITKVERIKGDVFKRVMEQLRKEEKDDIAFAIRVKDLKRDLNRWIKKAF